MFSVRGHPVTLDYVVEAIKRLGPREFKELNPWITDFIKKAKKKADRKIELDKSPYMVEMDAYLDKRFRRQIIWMKDRGWTDKEVKDFMVGDLKERTKRKAEDATLHPSEENVSNVEYEFPDDDYIDEKLRHLFKFSKEHKVRY